MGRLILLFSFVLNLTAQPIRFAVIGDYGVDNANEAAVASLVNGFLPEFIVTTGDNVYMSTPQFDRAVGKYYSSFMGNYSGAYGNGSATNRFFPSIGNHDYFSDGFSAYTNYFRLPGNERYYAFTNGPAVFFILNSDSHEPDGTSPSSTQALWLSNSLRQATAPWKIVVLHHAPYSSSSGDSRVRWPFAAWGVSGVLTGHAHNYERIHRDGIVYFVNGTGGAPLANFGEPIEGSAFRYNSNFGAMLVNGDESHLTFSFYSVQSTNSPLDTYTLTKRPGPVSLPRITIRKNANQLVLEWPAEFTGYVLYGSGDLSGWTQLSATNVGNVYQSQVPLSSARRYFRLQR